MALDIDTYHRPTRPSTQKPLEACYGYPPPPSALLQMPIPTSARSDSQDAGSPSPTPPAISPPTTPLLLTQQSFNQNGMHQELLNIECGTDLAEYLAKNPGMKRLYNNHGSIKRPACGKSFLLWILLNIYPYRLVPSLTRFHLCSIL